jgi:hypothetical protein
MDPIIDYQIHGKSPILNVLELNDPFMLKNNEAVMVQSHYQYSVLHDNLSWLQLGLYGKKSYEYIELTRMTSSIVKEGGLTLYHEVM